MGTLEISTDGSCYTDKEKKAFWLKITREDRCPECNAKASMLKGPCGGVAFNIKCKHCQVVFWLTPFPDLGAYPISIDNPVQGERRLISS